MEESDDRDLWSPAEDEVARQETYMESTEDNQEYESDNDGDSYDELTSTLTGSEMSAGLVPPPDLSKISHEDRVKMIHLRRYLEQLSEKVLQKDYVVQKTREELKKCHDRLEELQIERQTVSKDISSEEALENMAAVFRLRSQLERVDVELDAEIQLESEIRLRLDETEYGLCQAQVEQGKYLLADAELRKQEERFDRERSDMAGQRLKKEHHYAAQAERRRRSRERDNHGAIRERDRKHRQAMAEARRSREKASKFLKQTLYKVRQQESEEESRGKEELERRIDTVASLKQNISANKENLRALQARDQARAKLEEEADILARNAILEKGGNPETAMLVQKRKQEFQKQKESFEMLQEENKIEIASRILREEQRMMKRVQQQPHLFHDNKREKTKRIAPHRKRKLKIFHESGSSSMEYSADVEEDLKSPEEMESHLAPLSSDEERPIIAQHSKTALPESDSEAEDATLLAKPEFEGLWNQHKPYSVPKQVEGQTRLPGASKMEQDILDKVLDKHRSGIVRKQVVAGKEFKGIAFYSKPDVIHFKDFEIGKSYRKKVTLTNVSYSVNHCKLLGITESLKDFIHIQFDPPGQMSAGLTCEMVVTFKPMINEDLEGTVDFMALTGPFSVPLRCTTKKCDLSIDVKNIDFGTTVIGETMKRTFTLSNNGGLGTRFELLKLSGLKATSMLKDDSTIGGMESQEEQSDSPSKEMDSSKTQDESKPLNKASKPEVDDLEMNGQGEPEVQEGQTENEAEAEVNVAASQEESMLDEDNTDYENLDGLSVGMVKAGEIGPFSSVRLEIIWQPTIPGHVVSEFVLLFDDSESERLELTTSANAIDVPVWVQRQNIDLKICMFDRLYQDTIIVYNRATTALRLKFEVCKELRNHIELLPKTGYIQAHSQFSAQLKFIPRKSLFDDGGEFFDKETGVLEAPMSICVADQTRPVPFTVHAVATNSDMRFDVDHIDFGHATIYESVKKTIRLTNESILPQKFGFVGLSQYVQVQPDDGFGTLLPLETIELDVIFSPPKAGNYSFEMTCKSIINREFKITCTGVGVHPPLKLDRDVIHYKGTAMEDVSMTSFNVINEHTSTNEFTHPVPRIGKGDICSVGPTSFEFVVPDGAPITLSPCVGTVEPGKKARIHVRYSPSLGSQNVKMEAVEMIKRKLEARAEEEYRQALLREEQAAEEEEVAPIRKQPKKDGKNAKGGKPGKSGKKEKEPKKSPTKLKPDPGLQLTITGQQQVDAPEWETIQLESDDYAQAHASLLRQYKPELATYVVPCYVASGKCGKPGELKYSVHNTLYLVIHCPSIKPELAVISDNGRQSTDFGEVSKGQSIIRSVTIQNISSKNLDLTASILSTDGPFMVLNSFRLLETEMTHTILVSFTPQDSKKFYEVLEINSGHTTLHLVLQGRGVTPRVTLSVDGVLDMGAVITGEYVERTFTIGNSSTLAIDYAIKLDSTSLFRHLAAQDLPEFVHRNPAKRKHLVGAQNNNGSSVFDCVPAEGNILPGSSLEITVTFAPDHDSDLYSDGIRLELFGQDESHSFKIIGQAKPHIVYMCGGDEITSGTESLSVLPVTPDEGDGKPPPKILLLSLYSEIEGDELSTAQGEVFAGCVRTMAVSQKKDSKKDSKKNGEFSCENPAAIMAKGFNVEPQKGQVEAGMKKPIVFTWTPPPKHDANIPIEAQILFTAKGDATEQYLIMLRGFVVTDQSVHKKSHVTDAPPPLGVEIESKSNAILKSRSTVTPGGTTSQQGGAPQQTGASHTSGPVMPVIVPP